ncbi:MAG TPA: hypothetical protein VK950_00430 [Methylophilus sp.]|nr:hypothetical protein [Methylophilus sp.]
MDKEKACGHCGSVYKLSYTRITMRDQDSIDCEVCGHQLHRWSEAKIWEAKLIERKENHNTQL